MRQWRWLWSCCPGIGPARLRALIAEATSLGIGLEECWLLSRDQLGEMLGWPSSLLDRVERYRSRCGISPNFHVPPDLVMPGDVPWPSLLDSIDRPPMGLFVQGKRSLLSCLQRRQAVAVVGTRAASVHGRRIASNLGRALAESGWPVLSGLAEGVDAAAHRGCLEGGGSPIAILGTSLDRVYPRHHRPLQGSVGDAGLLISEHPPATPIQRGHFVSRNRLLVAFASAVVVVECPERSGALISARMAISSGCPLWVVPGDAARWSAKGSNELLCGRALPLLSPETLIRHLGPGPLDLDTVAEQEVKAADSQSSLTCDQKVMLKELDQGLSVEELSRLLGRSVGSVVHDLLQIELRGLAVCYEGNHWRSVRR